MLIFEVEAMQVQCALCDTIESIEDNSYEAKRLLNKRIRSYLCKNCYDRITEQTEKRLATGKFKFHRGSNNNNNKKKNNKAVHKSTQ